MNTCTEVRGFIKGEGIETDLLELNNYGNADLGNLCFRPFEIKTILIKS